MIHLPTSLHAILTLEPETCARHLLSVLDSAARSRNDAQAFLIDD